MRSFNVQNNLLKMKTARDGVKRRARQIAAPISKSARFVLVHAEPEFGAS
jgi:hypothetical protein